MHYLSRNR